MNNEILLKVIKILVGDETLSEESRSTDLDRIFTSDKDDKNHVEYVVNGRGDVFSRTYKKLGRVQLPR